MPKALKPGQIVNYRANGYLYPLDGLSAAEVKKYCTDLAVTESHLGGSLMAIDKKYRGNLHFMCRWVDEIARYPRIVDVVEDLLGPDILLYTSRFFIKEPHSERIAAWHQDSTYFGLRPFDHVTAWVALCDVTPETGPVEFAVGSHIRGQLMQKSGVIKNSVNTAGQIIVEWFVRYAVRTTTIILNCSRRRSRISVPSKCSATTPLSRPIWRRFMSNWTSPRKICQQTSPQC